MLCCVVLQDMARAVNPEFGGLTGAYPFASRITPALPQTIADIYDPVFVKGKVSKSAAV